MQSSTITADIVHAVVDRVLAPGKFFVAPPASLRVEFTAVQTVPWEVFRGHLLDPAHTRQSIVAATWSVFVDGPDSPAEAPLICVHHQHDSDHVHVTRQILTYGFEAYEESPGVIQSRGVQKWVRELVGTLDVRSLAPADVESELATAAFMAVIGTSRLPITSIESPLPAFSLGHLGYAPGLSGRDEVWSDAIAFFRAAVAQPRNAVHVAKALETALRSVIADELPRLAEVFEPSMVDNPQAAKRITTLFRTLFNHVALSPYTPFVDRLVGLFVELDETGRASPGIIIDVVSYMLRHLCRHLTAFDLTLFHNFGANYPDALFMDSLLKAYLNLAAGHSDLFLDDLRESPSMRSAKCRRRALRQACLVRKSYEGHLVPDAPTSMGENLRVLPPPFSRVSQEQITQPGSRRRKLFEGDALENTLADTARQVFRQSIADLTDTSELVELGMAGFLARPLGILKAPGEVDRTPLVAYEAFSRSIATRRLGQLQAADWNSPEEFARLRAELSKISVDGLPASDVLSTERPGVVSLADVHKPAPDFVLLRSTANSLKGLLSHYDLAPLEQAAPAVAVWLCGREAKILVPVEPADGAKARLRFYDTCQRLRLELGWPPEGDEQSMYRFRKGIELVDALQVLRVGGEAGEQNLRERAVWLKLR